MAITYKITENGKERSALMYQTDDWYDALKWITDDKHPKHCIQFEGIDGMSIKEFNALNDNPAWQINAKQVVID